MKKIKLIEDTHIISHQLKRSKKSENFFKKELKRIMKKGRLISIGGDLLIKNKRLFKLSKRTKMKTKNKENLIQFLEDHRNEIIGLYRDTYYRNGGWNGLMDAISEVEKRYNFNFDYDSLKEGELEIIIDNWKNI